MNSSHQKRQLKYQLHEQAQVQNNQPDYSLDKEPDLMLNEQLDLDTFKVDPCPQQTQHNYRRCMYYHNDLDRRRDPQEHTYTPEFCQDMALKSQCSLGDRCSQSHSKAEQAYHVDKYRKKFCSFFPARLNECPYHRFCSYAHSEDEIHMKLLHTMKRDVDFFLFHLKTQFCPLSAAHDRAKCVYAHNWQDFRRDPSQYRYVANLCRLWDRRDKVVDYTKACPRGYSCSESHGKLQLNIGWKELDFHYEIYKTRPCTNKQCQRDFELCPHYHDQYDRYRMNNVQTMADGLHARF